jgi:hypothetical protein
MVTVLYIQKVLLTAAQWDNYEEMYFTTNGAPPHFELSVRAWLESHITGRWIGRRGPTVWPSRYPHLNSVIYFCGAAPKRTYPDRNQDCRMNWNNKFEPFAAVSLYLLRNVWTLCLPGCRSVCKILGAKLKSDTE